MTTEPTDSPEVTRASFEARVRALDERYVEDSGACVNVNEAAAIAAEADAQLAALREAAQGLRVALAELRAAYVMRASCQYGLVARCKCLKCVKARADDLCATFDRETAK